MTEAQARAKLQKLLAITLDRGAAPGEQANATRVIGALLQKYPGLRDIITGVGDTAAPPLPGSTWEFWKGVLCGVGATVVMPGALVLSSLFNQSSDAAA